VTRVYVVDLLGLVLALGAAPSVAPPPMEVVRPAKKIVVVHAAPGGRAGVRVGPRTEYGSPIRYAVVERRGRWLGVITPAVPNGRVGWVRESAVRRVRYVRERVEVDLSRRLLRVLMDERVVLETRVAVGAAESPTPIGRFAITDKVPGSSLGSVYGCCVLVLSGHQPRPPRGWAPVDYRLAIHGGDGRTIGRPISAGCVHVRAATLRFLMKRLPVGTRVTIHP
jgi:lipoprotein-anchoring transpeptidase ErfK/SrfK